MAARWKPILRPKSGYPSSMTFRRRNGESLPEELKDAAMLELDDIINAALAAE